MFAPVPEEQRIRGCYVHKNKKSVYIRSDISKNTHPSHRNMYIQNLQLAKNLMVLRKDLNKIDIIVKNN